MNTLKATLSRLLLGRLWTMWRSSIEAATVPDSGGFVFLGDSITHNGRWELMFPNAPIRNFGISGERSDQLLLRLAPIISLRPSKLFLLIGTNDLAVGASIDDIAGNVARLIDELRAALPGCTFYLQTVMPRARKFATRIGELNGRYTQLAAQRGIEVIDLFPLFDDGTGKIRQEVTNDDLHLMGPGYEIWRQALVPYVREADS